MPINNEGACTLINVVNKKAGSIYPYFMKNVQTVVGQGKGDENFSTERNAAWRVAWSIRDTQGFGILNGALTLWHEFCRIKKPGLEPLPLWSATIEGRAANFLQILGGLSDALIEPIYDTRLQKMG